VSDVVLPAPLAHLASTAFPAIADEAAAVPEIVKAVVPALAASPPPPPPPQAVTTLTKTVADIVAKNRDWL
jgi:hypothetical protein